jgi:hypothetical protein
MRLEYKWIVAIVFVIRIFMDLLDTTIPNVAVRRSRRTSTSRPPIEW